MKSTTKGFTVLRQAYCIADIYSVWSALSRENYRENNIYYDWIFIEGESFPTLKDDSSKLDISVLNGVIVLQLPPPFISCWLSLLSTFMKKCTSFYEFVILFHYRFSEDKVRRMDTLTYLKITRVE